MTHMKDKNIFTKQSKRHNFQQEYELVYSIPGEKGGKQGKIRIYMFTKVYGFNGSSIIKINFSELFRCV